MLDGATADWRTARRATARSDILRAAWGLARENGLAGLSLRDLAARLGMRAPSLYSYFPSKDAIYDAMFAQGYREFLDLDRRPGADLAGELRLRTQDFVRFCLDEPRPLPAAVPADDPRLPAVGRVLGARPAGVRDEPVRADRVRRHATGPGYDHRGPDRARRPADLQRPGRWALGRPRRRGGRHAPRAPDAETPARIPLNHGPIRRRRT